MGDLTASIRAVDVPEVRAETIAWLNEYGASFFTVCIRNGSQSVYRVDLSDAAEGARLASAEAERLAGAELFWVSREMTELCVAAARTMPAWELQSEDLVAPAGMIYFEGLPDFRPQLSATAMAWSPCPADVIASTGIRGPAIWLSCYAGLGYMARQGMSLHAPWPPLVYDGESIASFGKREAGEISFARRDGLIVEESDDSLIERCSSLVVFKAACLLMQQGLADVETVEPYRASRKRIQRMQQEPKSVRVIKLRRASHSTGTGESDREYHHQWIVRGHWRQQWYASREVHRPVWIAPHIKGPEGAPLIGGEKVHALVR